VERFFSHSLIFPYMHICFVHAHMLSFMCMIKHTTHSFKEDAFANMLERRKELPTQYGRGFFSRRYSDEAARHVASLPGFVSSSETIEFCMALRVFFFVFSYYKEFTYLTLIKPNCFSSAGRIQVHSRTLLHGISLKTSK
jgi:hypothetical protein